MDVDWAIRPPDAERPVYPPKSDYFTILLHYTLGDVMKWSDRRFSGYVDYCCADKMSRLEIMAMAKELNLVVQGCTFWWLDVMSERMGMREIKDDADALAMAQTANLCREINVYAKVTRVLNSTLEKDGSLDEDGKNSMLETDGNVHEYTQNNLPGKDGGLEEHIQNNNVDSDGSLGEDTEINLLEKCRGFEGDDAVVEEEGAAQNDVQNQEQDQEEMDQDSGLYDSEYNFSSEYDEEVEGGGDAHEASRKKREVDSRVEVNGRDGDEIESDYDSSGELHSCSSTDDEMVVLSRPKYAEFIEEYDMRDPHFEVGMKFRSFKQFREAVRNYGIKHRVVMNFKPSNSKRVQGNMQERLPLLYMGCTYD